MNIIRFGFAIIFYEIRIGSFQTKIEIKAVSN